jgi:hypothetical protein
MGEMLFYLFFGAFGRKYDMDDQISQYIGDQDLVEGFPQVLARLRGCVEQDEAAGALAAAKTLQGLFDRLLQLSEPNAGYQVRASLTEIHRLLRISQRDLLFWQGAKQTRAGRSTQVLATLVSIEGFYSVLTMNQTEQQSKKKQC